MFLLHFLCQNQHARQKVNGVLVKRHLVSQTLKPSIAEWDERNKPVKESTVDRINSKLPLYPEPIIERATELLESNSWAKVAAGLIALTGRRPTEIAWSGNFEPESNYSLIFSGQLKKGAIESQSFSIPTLIEANLILVAFERLRNLQHNKTKILKIDKIAEATQATNSQINRCVYLNFDSLLDAPPDDRGRYNFLSATNLRAAYGRIADYFYCPVDFEPILYTAQILGHKTDNYELESLGTAIHYRTYRIVDRSGNPINDRGIYLHRFNSPDVTNSRSPVTENSPTTETESIINQPIMQQTNTVTENLSLTDNPVTDLGMSGTQLADRFDVSRPTIGRNRKKGLEHFAAWSKKSDPNGIAWKFLKRGKLPDSQHIVDIYLPIAHDDPILSQLDKINENKPSVVVNDPKPVQAVPKSRKRSQPRASQLQLNKDKQERFQSLCNNLGLIGNFDRQFDQLLDWAEGKLTTEQSLLSESNPTDNEQLLVKAIETIAQFSKNLNNTLVPFTEELKIFNQQHYPAPNQEIDRPQQTNGTTSKEIESIKETDIEPATTPVEDPIAPSIENERKLDSQPTPTTDNNDRLSRLNGSDLSATIDALNLAISIKQSAIAKEKKKRSRKDDRTIALWLQEISAIKRSIELLE